MPWSRLASETSKAAREAKPLVLSVCWRSKSRPARFSAASAEASCALACSTALSSAVTWRPMRSMVACWVAILAARGIHRDAIVAVIDPENHVAGANDRIVAGQDCRDMARDPGAERGVVGANVSVVGRDIEAPDQDVVDAVTDRGEREQCEHADHDEFALARFCRGGIGARRRRSAGCGAGASAGGAGSSATLSRELVRELRAPRAASSSAVSGPARTMRAAWSLAAAITGLPILQYRDARAAEETGRLGVSTVKMYH